MAINKIKNKKALFCLGLLLIFSIVVSRIAIVPDNFVVLLIGPVAFFAVMMKGLSYREFSYKKTFWILQFIMVACFTIRLVFATVDISATWFAITSSIELFSFLAFAIWGIAQPAAKNVEARRIEKNEPDISQAEEKP